MNNKNKVKTILFASLIAAMILPFSGMNFAEAQEDPIDTTDYFSQAVVHFEENKKLQNEIDIESEEISSLTEKIKTANSSEKLKIAKDIKEKETNIKDKKNNIRNNEKTIDELEVKNIKAHKVNSQKQDQYTAIENAFYNEYVSPISSATDGNPVEDVFIDAKLRNLVVIVNPNEIKSFGLNADSLKDEYEQFIKTMPGNNLTVKLENGIFAEISCSARDANCNPVFAGLNVSNEDEIGTGFSTMSYKAKLGSTVGFIMTGHGAGGSNNDIVQPDDQNRVVGNVDAYSYNTNCDCAFVDINYPYSVSNEIYKSSNQVYTITDETADSSQTVGSWVYKSGANTAVTLGKITQNSSSKSYNMMYIYHGPNDSGSPVFDLSGNNADLYGMVYSSYGGGQTGNNYLRYHAYDHINSVLGTSLP